MILGHLIAHEMGHLLLGPDGHSRSGLMHVPWSKGVLERASRGSLLFTRKQVKQIQAQVARRIESTVTREQGNAGF